MSAEYKVLYAEDAAQWEVHHDDECVGYKAWDQSVALSYAKDVAKKNRPSTIVIHNKDGTENKQIEYPEKGSAIETKINK